MFLKIWLKWDLQEIKTFFLPFSASFLPNSGIISILILNGLKYLIATSKCLNFVKIIN